MITLLTGDCRQVLLTLPEQSVQTVVTSPPYFGLRRYDVDGDQIGDEPTPAAYVAALVDVFRAVRRVLRDDGTCWVNLGDSYAGNGTGGLTPIGATGQRKGRGNDGLQSVVGRVHGIPEKNLIGIPWRVAFALQDDGWILRSDIIWAKPNPMPESVRDRPTRSHEYLFLFSKQPRYYYDADAIREPGSANSHGGGTAHNDRYPKAVHGANAHNGLMNAKPAGDAGRNRRTVWTIATRPYSGAHFAVFPEQLIEPCILAGSANKACPHCGAAWVRQVEKGETPWEHRKNKGEPIRRGIDTETIDAVQRGTSAWNGQKQAAWKEANPDRDLGFAPACACPDNDGSARSTVLDPFAGSGTTMRVAERYGRNSIGIDLGYLDLQEQRTDNIQVHMEAFL
jgi:DNA modification methylase